MADENAPFPGESWQDYGKRMQEMGAANAKQEAPADPLPPVDENGEPLNDPTFESTIGVTPPKVDKPKTREEATEFGRIMAEFRKEIADLRREMASHRPRVQQVATETETPEMRQEARLQAIADSSHYCPGCGALGKYAQKCDGSGSPSGHPHPPLEMVSTDELGGDPHDHTRAPSTDPDFPDRVAA